MAEGLVAKISEVWVRRRLTWLCVLIVTAACLYSVGIGSNPPGFYIDESAVAYNAHLIAQTGTDEHGVFLPLYFKSFGEFKNPTFIYLLAAVDRIVGPSIVAARGLSAAVGFGAALLLGFLAARISGRDFAGVVTGGFALFAPWLYEISRLSYEVAIFPLAVVLYLYCLYRASRNASWSVADGARIAISLALITYSYSIGRLLAPLLALGLVVFVSRLNLLGVFQAWLLYVLTLLPLFFFVACSPKALVSRFYSVSYIRPENTLLEILPQWVAHYLNVWNPRLMFLVGDESARQHVVGTGVVLFGMFVMGLVGIVIGSGDERQRPWWLYIAYGALVSVIPASLTNEPFHSLRLVALPVFLSLMAVPALASMIEIGRKDREDRLRRNVLAGLVFIAAVQMVWFQYVFHTDGRNRTYEFDAPYPVVLEAALATGEEQIFLWDRDEYPSYIHAYWYSTLKGHDTSRFIRLKTSTLPPPGSLVLGTRLPCETCQIVSAGDSFTAYYFVER